MTSEVENLLGESDSFHVFKRGKLTVIGFEAHQLAEDAVSLRECQRKLLDVVEQNQCQVLAVDLLDVGLMSSWILSVLAAAHRMGIEVHLYHPSADIKDVLEVTHLDQLLRIRRDLTET